MGRITIPTMKQPATPRQGDTNRQNNMVNGKWKMEFTQSLSHPPTTPCTPTTFVFELSLTKAR